MRFVDQVEVQHPTHPDIAVTVKILDPFDFADAGEKDKGIEQTKALIGKAILGWKGFEDADGNTIALSAETGTKYLFREELKVTVPDPESPGKTREIAFFHYCLQQATKAAEQAGKSSEPRQNA